MIAITVRESCDAGMQVVQLSCVNNGAERALQGNPIRGKMASDANAHAAIKDAVQREIDYLKLILERVDAFPVMDSTGGCGPVPAGAV